MINQLNKAICVGIIFIMSMGRAYAVGFGVENVENLPTTIGPDAEYTFFLNYSTPENIDKFDMQVSLKHPASGYAYHGAIRRTFGGSERGFAYFSNFKAINAPEPGEGYIWEVKFLQEGQVGEDDPIFYYTQSVTIKDTAFKINALKVPAKVQPYDSYEVSIDYEIDESVSGYMTLNNEYGEEVLRLSNISLWDTNELASRSFTTTIVNDPVAGDYTWNLVLQARRGDGLETVIVESAATEVYLEDKVKSINVLSAAIAPDAIREVEIAYTATQDRELLVELWSSNANHYRVVREPISRGSGTLEIPVYIPENIEKINDYRWQVKIVPVGGQWWQRLDEGETPAVVASNFERAPFFDYPIFSYPNESFNAEKFSAKYELEVDENIDGNAAAIYLKQIYTSSSTELTFNLDTGDVTIVRNNTWSGYTEETVANPYRDETALVKYRSLMSTFNTYMRLATENLPQLNDAYFYIQSVYNEVNGISPEYASFEKLYFSERFRRYDINFYWRDLANHPARIQVSTDGLQVGNELHHGFTIIEKSAYGLLTKTYTLDLETGVITRKESGFGVDEFISFFPPYSDGGSELTAYLAVLSELESRLRKLAIGTQRDGAYLSYAYPQMKEYADSILTIYNQLKPIVQSHSDLFFDGEVSVFEEVFAAVGGGNHPDTWTVEFIQNADGRGWTVNTRLAPGFPSGRLEVNMNLATGEIYLLDETVAESINQSIVPPGQGGDVNDYKYALSQLVRNISRVETMRVDYKTTRPKPQLAQFRLYIESIISRI